MPCYQAPVAEVLGSPIDGHRVSCKGKREAHKDRLKPFSKESSAPVGLRDVNKHHSEIASKQKRYRRKGRGKGELVVYWSLT